MRWKARKWLLALSVGLVLAGFVSACTAAPKATPTPSNTAPGATAQYAHPELLAETDWLAQHLNDSNVIVVDVRSAADYQSGHIPGSVNLDTKDAKGQMYDQSNPVKWIVAPKAQVETVLGGLGISNNTTVIAVDNDDMLWASRLFWTLEYYGHGNGKTKVLNGGIKKWKAENRELTGQTVERKAATFVANQDASKIALKQQILDSLGKGINTILATIPEAEFKGGNAKGHVKGGHIPGALQLDWTQNLTSGDVKVFKSASELAQQYEALGVTKGKGTVLY